MALFKTTPDLAVKKDNSLFSGTITLDFGVAQWDYGDGSAIDITNTPSNVFSDVPPYLINLIDTPTSYFSRVTGIDLNNKNLTGFNLSRFPNILTIDVSDNSLSSSELCTMFTDLDGFGLSNGTLDYENNTEECETGTGRDAYDSLLAKGWTITGDVPLSSFIITVKSDNSGTSNNDQFTLPLLTTSGNLDLFYDGTSTLGVSASTTITFPSGAGTYEIKIKSNSYVGAVIFASAGDKDKILDITQWGRDFQWGANLSNAFANCDSLTVISARDYPDFSGVTSVFRMFNAVDELTYINLTGLDTSNMTSFYGMFEGANKLAYIDGTGTWDTSSCTSFNSMFRSCNKLKAIDLSNWDLSSATNIGNMFNACSLLTTIDVSNWDTSHVTDFSSVFISCTSLTTLDVSGWLTDNVTNMSNMFSGCSSLTSIDLSNFSTLSLTNMANMFSTCSQLTSIDISTFSGTMTLFQTFTNCTNLTSITFPASGLAVTSFSSSMVNCSSLTTVTNLGNVDITGLTSAIDMFTNCTLDTAEYDEILIGWEAQAYPSGITFSGGNSTYSAGAAATARANLVAAGWTITDGGLA